MWFCDRVLLKTLHAISPEVYETIRIEAGIPLQGVDFTTPVLSECGVDNAISYTKGCYLGQEIICRIHNLGRPAKKLVRILYDTIPKNGNVTVSGSNIGTITSRCHSPRYGKYLVFAMLREYDKDPDGGVIVKG